MIRVMVAAILIGTTGLTGLALALEQRTSQLGQSSSQLRGDTTQQLQPRPETLLKEINALKGQVAVLQQQVAALQQGAATISALQTRLSKLESVLAVDAAGNVSLQSSSKIKINAAVIEANAGTVTVKAGVSGFHGVLKADTVISKSMISASYSPGAGNIW